MHDSYELPPGIGPYEPRRRRASRVWLWLLIGVGLFIVLPCGGCLSWVFYLGFYGPETSVYTGNQVPARFVETMKSVGALDDDETVIYFYSDALSNIRDGFYFVSDRKVAVYSEASGGSPLQVVRFDEIADLELVRDESFFEDSEITLQLKDGQLVSFPVSSELDKDEKFFDAIQMRVAETSGSR